MIDTTSFTSQILYLCDVSKEKENQDWLHFLKTHKPEHSGSFQLRQVLYQTTLKPEKASSNQLSSSGWHSSMCSHIELRSPQSRPSSALAFQILKSHRQHWSFLLIILWYLTTSSSVGGHPPDGDVEGEQGGGGGGGGTPSKLVKVSTCCSLPLLIWKISSSDQDRSTHSLTFLKYSGWFSLKSRAANLLAASSGLGSLNRHWMLNKMEETLETGNHLVPRMSIHPSSSKMFGWNIFETNLTSGGLKGYSSLNSMVSLNVPSSKGVSFGPQMTAFQSMMLFPLGAAEIPNGGSLSSPFKSRNSRRVIAVASILPGGLLSEYLNSSCHCPYQLAISRICLSVSTAVGYSDAQDKWIIPKVRVGE